MKNCKSKIRNKLIITLTILSAIIFTATSCNKSYNDILFTIPLEIGKDKLLVNIALTTQEQAKGLSRTKKLLDQQGMLFDFTNNASIKTFWMKEMNYDLDIIWIKDNKIVGITENIKAPKKNTPESELIHYNSPLIVDMVLEVNAGWSKKNNIKIGEEIKIVK